MNSLAPQRLPIGTTANETARTILRAELGFGPYRSSHAARSCGGAWGPGCAALLDNRLAPTMGILGAPHAKAVLQVLETEQEVPEMAQEDSS